jgi:hypothetical protein
MEQEKRYTYEQLTEMLGDFYEKDHIDFIYDNFLGNSEKSKEVLQYCLDRVAKLKELSK